MHGGTITCIENNCKKNNVKYSFWDYNKVIRLISPKTETLTHEHVSSIADVVHGPVSDGSIECSFPRCSARRIALVPFAGVVFASQSPTSSSASARCSLFSVVAGGCGYVREYTMQEGIGGDW
ncbi:hypothetical protein QTP88_019767 [Uroleucon formosanum]